MYSVSTPLFSDMYSSVSLNSDIICLPCSISKYLIVTPNSNESGITFNAFPDVAVPIETVKCLNGFKDLVCNNSNCELISFKASIGDLDKSGLELCPPFPLILTLNNDAAAILGPGSTDICPAFK